MRSDRRSLFPTKLRAGLAAGIMLLQLGGCGRGRPADESQIAAHINEGEISVHQVHAIMQRQPKLANATAETAAAQVLEVLIDQELAAQAAIKHGLESDPAVVQVLQLARREALARAYHDRAAAQAVPPSSDEIDRYYEAHPALFARRKFYTLQEVTLEAAAAQLKALEGILATPQSADAVLVFARERGLRHTAHQFVQASEDVPLGLLERIAELPTGQSVLLPHAGGARIFSIMHTQAAPVDRRAANDAIAKFLLAEQKRKAVAQTMGALRKEARLRYIGAFAKAAPALSTDQVPQSRP